MAVEKNNSSNSNTTVLIVGGIAVAGIAAYLLMNSSNNRQQYPMQPTNNTSQIIDSIGRALPQATSTIDWFANLFKKSPTTDNSTTGAMPRNW